MHAFDVLADPVRRQILEVIAVGEKTAGEIVEVIVPNFGISQSAVSQHLRVLREHGFAQVRAEGTRRCYSIEPTGFRLVGDWLAQFAELWAPRRETLATEVARGNRGKNGCSD